MRLVAGVAKIIAYPGISRLPRLHGIMVGTRIDDRPACPDRSVGHHHWNSDPVERLFEVSQRDMSLFCKSDLQQLGMAKSFLIVKHREELGANLQQHYIIGLV